ncbi:hypothetical protein RF55_18237 [Lasius niger]|uniref:RNA-directed DNA polymerase n=1 Tax=Lasius niger TaxID=67767 RepID=A0A0J7MUM4_LASNI|nr:hypothetical protein RF55_18237 [Lasius niger]
MAFLGEFDLEICHVPGKENKIADTLSRNNVKNRFVKKEDKIKRIAVLKKPDDVTETAQWVELIANAQRADEQLRYEINESPEDLPEREGISRIRLTKGERVVVPEAVKWELVKRIHNYLLHFGTDKVTDYVNRYFMVNNVERVVRDVVASCDTCQSTKYYTRPTRGVEYYDLPEKPCQTVSVDLFGPLPQSPRGNKYILVAMDQFSKLTKLYPIKNQKLDSIKDCLQLGYFSEIGIPDEILTDNGGQFITDRWQEFAIQMGFSVRKTSPYNPQSNPVERVMRELGRIIRAYAHERQTRWDTIIVRAENTINSTTHRSTGYRPVDLHEDMEGRLPIDPRLEPIQEYEEEMEKKIEEKIEIAKETLQRRARQRKIQTDKHGEAKEYQPGDKIWVKLHRRSDANRRLTRKIHLVYDGPYSIQKEVRKNAYLVQDEHGNVLGIYNSRQIKPHREAKWKPRAEINMIEIQENDVSTINDRMIKNFIDKMMKNHVRDTSKVNVSKQISEDTEEVEPRIRSQNKKKSSTSKEKGGEENLNQNKKKRILSREESEKTRKQSEGDTSREESDEMQGNPVDGENLKKKKKLAKDKTESDVLIWGEPIRTSTSLNPSTNGEEEDQPILKNRRSRISEKGMRHVKRLMNLISGRKGLPFLMGTVERLQTKIIMDTRGKFNVITRATVDQIEEKVRKLTCTKNSNNIPAYLKREKQITFKTVMVETQLFGRQISVEAMILDSEEKCLVLGRKSRKKLGKKIGESLDDGYQLKRSTEHLSLETLERLRKEEYDKRKSAAILSTSKRQKVHKSANNSIDDKKSKVHKSANNYQR